MRSRYLVLLLMGLPVWMAATCTPPGAETPAPVIITATDVEPNDSIAGAQALSLAGADGVTIAGALATASDFDVYSFGALAAGDRVLVTVDAAASASDVAIGVFSIQPGSGVGTTFAIGQYNAIGASGIVTIIDEIVRSGADNFAITLQRPFSTTNDGQSYSITLTVTRGGTAPSPAVQTIVLRFAGGSVNVSGGAVNIQPFEAASIDPSYTGQTPAITAGIINVVRENFADYGVQIVTDANPLPAGPFSSVYIGGIAPGSATLQLEGFGISPGGVDQFNHNPSDDAIVAAPNFSAEAFGFGTPLDAASLARAIGNTVCHEAGHLLGLQHAFDQTDLMNAIDAPIKLLVDQRFKRSAIHFTILDPLSALISQDGVGKLAQTVGLNRRTATRSYPVGSRPTDVAAADFNGDGLLDLAVANIDSTNITVLQNTGGANFVTRTLETGLHVFSLLAIDANNDGFADLVTTNLSENSLSIFYNDGTGRFFNPDTYTTGIGPWDLAAGDLDANGALDFVFTNREDDTVGFLFGVGFGSFTEGVPLTVGDGPRGITLADLNNDGWLDIAVANTTSLNVSVSLNTGNGFFAAPANFRCGDSPAGIATADLNNDGLREIVTANYVSSFSLAQYISDAMVLPNQGNGTFGTAYGNLVESNAQDVVAADFNGDGTVDLATAASGNSLLADDPGGVSVLYNLGGGTFTQNRVILAERSVVALALGDFDNDGRVDLAAVNTTSGTVSIILNEQLR